MFRRRNIVGSQQTAAINSQKQSASPAIEPELPEVEEMRVQVVEQVAKLPGPLASLPSSKVTHRDRSSNQPKKRQRLNAEETFADVSIEQLEFNDIYHKSLNTIAQQDKPNQAINKISSILNDTIQEKAPLLLCFLNEVRQAEVDMGVILKDDSGSIQGFIHKKVLDDFPYGIHAGCVLELQNVSVFKPTPRSKYLNITSNNIKSLFTNRGERIFRKDSTVEKRPRISQQQQNNDREVHIISDDGKQTRGEELAAMAEAAEVDWGQYYNQLEDDFDDF